MCIVTLWCEDCASAGARVRNGLATMKRVAGALRFRNAARVWGESARWITERYSVVYKMTDGLARTAASRGAEQ